MNALIEELMADVRLADLDRQLEARRLERAARDARIADATLRERTSADTRRDGRVEGSVTGGRRGEVSIP